MHSRQVLPWQISVSPHAFVQLPQCSRSARVSRH
jgi:hypothetical protein